MAEEWTHATTDGWGEDEHACSCIEGFETREAAAAAAPACLELEPGAVFLTGRIEWQRLDDIDPPFRDRMGELLGDVRFQMPGDWGDSFDPTETQQSQLIMKLEDVWNSWLDEHDLHPSTEVVVDVERHTAPERTH